MARAFLPKVATSNHLIEGDVIYYRRLPGGYDWTRELSEASVAHSLDEAETLLAQARNHPLETVGVELIDVALEGGRPVPTHFRETFRTRGPSNYFHGKQAQHV